MCSNEKLRRPAFTQTRWGQITPHSGDAQTTTFLPNYGRGIEKSDAQTLATRGIGCRGLRRYALLLVLVLDKCGRLFFIPPGDCVEDCLDFKWRQAGISLHHQSDDSDNVRTGEAVSR